ncbi:MAG: hypothetical protein H7A45_21325 [Verrucomicrobiales bacterium]|nr:hypothetical protein [Verrucomicrobiales bacterium]MCP5527824.1 hypothetical protein [Verrucomicrobiales bacterium]
MSTALEAPKVKVHQAVRTALKFFADSFKSQSPQDIQLEEIEMSDDGSRWLITVGYENPTLTRQVLTPLRQLVDARVAPRRYKVVTIDARTGHPVAIKIRPGL